MSKTINLSRNLLVFGIPLLLFGVLIMIMKSALLNGNNAFSLAITVDLLVSVPLVYFLLIRKTNIPTHTVFRVMLVGMVLGFWFLPKESQTYLEIFKTWAVPVFEVSIFAFLFIKIRKGLRNYKGQQEAKPDFFNALKTICQEMLPSKLVMPMATEISVMYYGFLSWGRRPLLENEFSYHKKSASTAIFGAFIMVVGIETLAFHFLLARWNIVVAWVLTGLSIYTALQVFALAKSLSRRPISIKPKSLSLKYGILNEVDIPFSEIESVSLTRKPLPKDPLTKTLSPIGALERHNVVIHLKNECEMAGFYGRKRKFKVLGLHIDEPKAFNEKLESAISATS